MEDEFMSLLNSQQFTNLEDDSNSENYNLLHNPNLNISNNPNFTLQNNPSYVDLETLGDPSQPSPSSGIQKQKKKTKRGETNPWTEKEDEALMSAWCFNSTDAILGKNQKEITRWGKVLALYDKSRLENPSEISERNAEALRCRFRKLNENANKWVSCYKAVIRQPRSGTNHVDDIDEAQKKFQELYGGEYGDLNVYNNVMSKYKKWSIDNDDNQSGGSSKRSRTNECSESNPDTSPSVNVNEPVRRRPEGRDTTKKKRKEKEIGSQSTYNSQFNEQLSAIKIASEEGNKVMQRKLEYELESTREDRKERKARAEMKLKAQEMQVYMKLLDKDNLTAEDEALKAMLRNKLWP